MILTLALPMRYYSMMDGIKKSLDTPQKTNENNIKLPTPHRPREEDIFISADKSQPLSKHEKKFRSRIRLKKIFLFAIGLTLVSIFSYGLYFSWKTYAISKKMNSQDSAGQTTLAQYASAIIAPIISKPAPLDGEADGRVNILLLGAAGENKPGNNLTDTVMMMSIDTKNKKVALLSLPRDLYVQIPESSSYTKINSLYPIGIKENRGVDLIKQEVEKITGTTINYYIAIDFDGFQKVIDDIGGVNVIAPRDIFDARYPGPNYSYETFSLTKGLHVFDGATALKYVRERHDDPLGDFGRAQRQQQVIQAVKNKLFSVKTLFNVVALNNILDTLGDNIRTNITFDDLNKFISLSKEVDMQNITNVVADAWQKDSLLKVSHVTLGGVQAFILIPRVGNYSEIQDLAQNIFDQTEIKKRQAAIAAENATIGISNQSGDNQLATKIQKLLTDKLNMKNVRIISKSPSSAPNSLNTPNTQTFVTDNSNGQKLFTLDELVKKLPAHLVSQSMATDNSYDIIITLGSDLAATYSFEENTMQDLQNAEDVPIDFAQ